MTRAELFSRIQQKRSYLCVGLDSDITKIPKHLLEYDDPVFEFNKQIIDATKDQCVAYKPNLAFYEALGARGWQTLEKTIAYIPSEHFIIADAKRGDIGNTSGLYAKAFFETLNVDAVTVAPYMGEDSVKPFLHFNNKWVILLALTSNAGSNDFQLILQKDGQSLYEKIMHTAMEWGSADELMFVIGATHPEKMRAARAIAPDYFFLVPGVGAQRGDLAAISRAGLNEQCGLLVNASRSILYAGDGADFAEKARAAASEMQQEMAQLLG
jgi:orotidine-5'-phosphate decarboxylase